MATETEVAEIKTEYPHIVRRPNVLGGRPIVLGLRLAVWQVANLWLKGESVPDLLDTYPGLTPAAVHSALAYYWDHKEEIDAEIEANRPENVLAELRRNPHLIEEKPGVFRHKTHEELANG